MENEYLRRNVYGFLNLCIAVIALIGLLIPVETVAGRDLYFGDYYLSNSIALAYMGFKFSHWLSIIFGALGWLQFIFAVGAIVSVALSFKKLRKHGKLINKIVSLGGVALTGLFFLFGLISIICNCVDAGSRLSNYVFTSFSFVPFGLTLALLFFMAKLDKKYAPKKLSVTPVNKSSNIEKITEYKKLLDDGVITEEEFNNFKIKILQGENINK